MRKEMQGLFVIIGTALTVVGLINSYPIAIVGAALIVLALVGRFRGGTKSSESMAILDPDV